MKLRRRQRRNFMFTLLVSIGVPMLSGGDELGRTQLGNNNGYCQDSTLSWTPWDGSPEEAQFSDFVRRLLELRASQPVLRRRKFLSGRRSVSPDVLWLRSDGEEMTDADWANGEGRTLGVLLDGDAILETDARGGRIVGDTLLILLNAGAIDLPVVLTKKKGPRWERLLDTAAPDGPALSLDRGATFVLVARSAAVFRCAGSAAGRVRDSSAARARRR
jgi:glycogen operon protein